MDLYSRSALFLSLAVLLTYVNHRFIRMQATIAIMTASLTLSLVLIALQHLGIIDIAHMIQPIIPRQGFQQLLLQGMLSFLLFAGALAVDTQAFRAQRWEIGTLACASTVASCVLIGLIMQPLLAALGVQMPLLYCLLFGALISATDPIAVLNTFKSLHAPPALQAAISGESLFNDGVSIVLYTTLFELTFLHKSIALTTVLMLFLKQTIGGLSYGIFLAICTLWLIKPIEDAKVILLVTLGMVSGGYSLALWLGISGPLAMVMLGLIVGAKLNQVASLSTEKSMREFWELLDEVLNAILFLLMGFEIITINISRTALLISAIMVAVVLLVRLVTVAVPIGLIHLKKRQPPRTIALLTWGGLRGGLALALALALPQSSEFDLIVSITYAVVAFSVIVQGLSIYKLLPSPKQAR